MRILLASSETLPYSKTGGLADMVGSLGKYLARAGHQVGLVTPLYNGILERFPNIKYFDWRFDLPLGPDIVGGGVWIDQPAPNFTVFFVDQRQFYFRGEIYDERGIPYPDNAERFIFFSKAVVHLARYHPLQPEILHVHDWPTGLVPALVREQKQAEHWTTAPPTILTIHNLAYQGAFPGPKFNLTNLPTSYFNPDGAEYYGWLNCLKAGISYGDLLTTVSPRYAREITTELFGCGLDGALRRRQADLVGVLNGVDDEEWTTVKNPYLKYSYTADDLVGKARNKALLQAELGLTVNPNIPLFGAISRLTDQKGIDIELAALQEMLAAPMQYIILGSGSREYERAFRRLAERHPGKCAAVIGFDTGLSHRIEAGADFYIMPSRFEPCGLNQLYSLRYGTVPIVRLTGGLDDSVIDITEDADEPDGIKFSDYSARALAKAIRKALALYQDQELLDVYRRNGMAKDFTWANTAQEYTALYRRLLPRSS